MDEEEHCKEQAQKRFQQELKQFLEKTTPPRSLSDAAMISSSTLMRWATGESIPRRPNLLRLLQQLSSQERQPLLLPASLAGFLSQEDASLLSETTPPRLSIEFIPSEFYAQIILTMTTTSMHMRFWTICQHVLWRCLSHLDPERVGLDISLLTCLPPTEQGEVQSLRERVFLGQSGLITEEGTETRFLLGQNSLVGMACTSFRATTLPHLPQEFLQRLHPFFPQAQSAAASPLLRGGRLGGCLLFLSHQPSFFSSARFRLVSDYAALIALSLEDPLFYDQICLAQLPPLRDQQAILSSIEQRKYSFLARPPSSAQELGYQQADLHAWQQIEQECIKAAQNSFQ